MNVLYYSEVNIICVVVLLIILKQMREKYIDNSVDKKIFNRILWSNIVFCISDMAAGIARGRFFYGSKLIIELSNAIYFETLALVAFLWFIYVTVRLGILKIADKKRIFLFSVPIILFTIFAVINPFTHFLFSIDSNNLYSRNFGVILHWIITWGYLISSTVLTLIAFIKSHSKQRRTEILPLLYFIVFPIIASTIQMLCYGVTSTQVGITLSLLLIFVNEQHNQVLTDSLTGMNNRKGLYHFFEENLFNRTHNEVTILMLDLNEFKKINDTYGHLVGDRALLTASQAISQASITSEGKHLLCRYGGDEFVIAAIDVNDTEITKLTDKLNKLLTEYNHKEKRYILEFSIGQAKGICNGTDDLDKLLSAADEKMYANKQLKKKLRMKN